MHLFKILFHLNLNQNSFKYQLVQFLPTSVYNLTKARKFCYQTFGNVTKFTFNVNIYKQKFDQSFD